MLRLQPRSQTMRFLKTTLRTKCNLVLASLSKHKLYPQLIWDHARSPHIAFTTQQLCFDSPQIFWTVRAERAIGGPRVITIGPWDTRAHVRKQFGCMLCRCAMEFLNCLRSHAVSTRNVVITSCSHSRIIMLCIVYLEFPYLVRGLVVVLCHAVLGTSQERARTKKKHISFSLYIYIIYILHITPKTA
jgi:hypothetical protein